MVTEKSHDFRTKTPVIYMNPMQCCGAGSGSLYKLKYMRKIFFIMFREGMISLKTFWPFSDLVLIFFLDLILNTDTKQKIFFFILFAAFSFSFSSREIKVEGM